MACMTAAWDVPYVWLRARVSVALGEGHVVRFAGRASEALIGECCLICPRHVILDNNLLDTSPSPMRVCP